MNDAYLRINVRHKYPSFVTGCPTILHDAQPSMVVVTTAYGPIAYVHFKLAVMMEAIECGR